MKDNNKPTTLTAWFRKKIYDLFGLRGLVMLAILGALFYIWLNWDKVSKSPGITQLLTYCSRQSVPKADPSRYSVLVAHLENDTNREFELLIIESLKELDGIQVLSLDRTITLHDSIPEKAEKEGYSQALRYLDESDASVLIWGTVLSWNGNHVPKLYWTVSQGWVRKPRRYQQSSIDDNLSLPIMFWDDLISALRLLILIESHQLTSEEGHFLGDRLPAYISRIYMILNSKDIVGDLDVKERMKIQFVLSKGLHRLGVQQDNIDAIKKSINIYRKLIIDIPNDFPPDYKADIQNELANALVDLVQYENIPELLKEALDLYYEALKKFSRENDPIEWAGLMFNIGYVQNEIGKSEHDSSYLEQALTTLFNAKAIIPQDQEPQLYANIIKSIGISLVNLGDIKCVPSYYTRAANAFREALIMTPREHFPLFWANLQNCLGFVMSHLGQLENNTIYFKEAIEAYNEALKEYTRERTPISWADITNNLGSAYLSLGNIEHDMGYINQAISLFHEALTELTHERTPLHYEIVQNNLKEANTLHERGWTQIPITK